GVSDRHGVVVPVPVFALGTGNATVLGLVLSNGLPLVGGEGSRKSAPSVPQTVREPRTLSCVVCHKLSSQRVFSPLSICLSRSSHECFVMRLMVKEVPHGYARIGSVCGRA